MESDGGTPSINDGTVSSYSLDNRFKRLSNSGVSQWIDVQSTQFVNWFTIPITSTKYVQLGRLEDMPAGDYRIIVKNSYPTNDDFTK